MDSEYALPWRVFRETLRKLYEMLRRKSWLRFCNFIEKN